jgi:hypothetical protein
MNQSKLERFLLAFLTFCDLLTSPTALDLYAGMTAGVGAVLVAELVLGMFGAGWR